LFYFQSKKQFQNEFSLWEIVCHAFEVVAVAGVCDKVHPMICRHARFVGREVENDPGLGNTFRLVSVL